MIIQFDFLDIINKYGYLGIFLGLSLGIIGLPIPDEFGMTTVGALVAANKIDLNIELVYLSALSGSICGITVSYLLGRKIGVSLIRRYGHYIWLNEAKLDKTHDFFDRWGGWLLPIGYFILGVRHFTAYVAGISKMPFGRFALFAYGGAIVWCATFIGLGYFLGEHAIGFFKLVHHYAIEAVLIAVIAAGLGFLFWRWRKSRK